MGVERPSGHGRGSHHTRQDSGQQRQEESKAVAAPLQGDPADSTTAATRQALSTRQWHNGEEQSALAALARSVTFLLVGRSVLTFGIAAVSGRKFSSAVRSFFSRDTARQASFFGAYAFIYIALRRYLASRSTALSDQVSNSFVAGSVAGLTLALDEPGRAHALATYMLSRAGALVCHAGVRKGWWPSLSWLPAAIFVLCEVRWVTSCVW